MPLLPGLDLARVLKMELALELQLLLLLVSPCQQPDLLRGPKPQFLLGQLAAFDLNLLVVNQRVKLQPLQGGPTTLVLLSFCQLPLPSLMVADDSSTGASTGALEWDKLDQWMKPSPVRILCL